MVLHVLRDQLRDVSAILLGCAVPVLVFGRAIFAIALCIGFLCLLFSRLRQVSVKHLMCQMTQPIGIMIAVTIILWSMSALGSSFPVRSLEAVLRTGVFVAVAVMIYAAIYRDANFRDLFSRAFILAAIIGMAFAVIAMIALPELYWVAKLKGWQSTSLETELKGVSSLSVIVIPALWVATRGLSATWGVAAIFAVACTLFLVWETYNRAALAGFIGIFLVGACFWSARQQSWHRLLAAWGAFLLLMAFAMHWLWRTREHLNNSVPAGDWFYPVWLIDFQRQVIWGEAFKIAENSFWFGIGANTINFAPGAQKPLPGQETLHIIPGHPHNWVVEIIAETGLIGLILLISTILAFFIVVLRKYMNRPASALMAAGAISAGYWVSGLFNFSYWSAWWQMAFLLMSGYCLACAYAGQPGARTRA